MDCATACGKCCISRSVVTLVYIPQKFRRLIPDEATHPEYHVGVQTGPEGELIVALRGVGTPCPMLHAGIHCGIYEERSRFCREWHCGGSLDGASV